MKIEIPSYKTLDLKYLMLDYNGTIAVDGKIPDFVRKKILALSQQFEIYILTGDTHGNVKKECENLPVQIFKCPYEHGAEAKAEFVRTMGKEHCVCIGNGRIDLFMFQEAELSIAVIGEEGAYGKLVAESDLCVRSMSEALELLEKPKRLIAGLRG